MKKRKKRIINNGAHPKKNSTSLSRKDYFIYGGGLVVYIFYLKSSNSIINYPNRIFCIVGGVVFALFLWYNLQQLAKEIKPVDFLLGKIFVTSLRVVNAAIFAWFVTGILLIPFNYYDIHAAEDNSSETIYCPIKGLNASSGHDFIYYEFQGASHILYGKVPIMNEIYSKGNYEEYKLVMTVKKALFGSYVLEDWDLEKR